MEFARPNDRIIVACDVSSLEDLEALVTEVGPHVGFLKVGLELQTAVGGPQAVAVVHQHNGRTMYDGKFDDIPNTVAGATRNAAKLKVSMLTVHASAGDEAIRAAVAVCGESKILGITVLTSLNNQQSQRIFGRDADSAVRDFADLLVESGAHGIVCSAQEAKALRRNPALNSLVIVTPAIRPSWSAATEDQARITTPTQAIQNGADCLVFGRPVLNPPHGMTRLEAVQRIADEIAEATAKV